MEDFSIINYQGSKANLLDFIADNIKNYIDTNEGILDIFSGSGAVSYRLKSEYKVYANDSELYATLIASSFLNPPKNFDPQKVFSEFYTLYNKQLGILNALFFDKVLIEKELINSRDNNKLSDFYLSLDTVWNSGTLLTPKRLRQKDGYNLFSYYYAGSYFGLFQAIQIDAIIYAIHNMTKELRATLYSCLFYGMKEIVFSKDGHMAQPLNIKKYPKRHIIQREKDILPFFRRKLFEYDNTFSNASLENKTFNLDFVKLLEKEDLHENISLIYADPPYTDMQYSRYYHLLNVAAKYNYPELTKNGNGYTKGLYTEERYQSKLSQKKAAKSQMNLLMNYCQRKNIALALSYAYPENTIKQATNRYTVSIEELINMARDTFGHSRVEVKQINYNHANNRNSSFKKVIEYLVLCGDKKHQRKYDIKKVKQKLANIKPTNRNDMYNSHLYWSQKSYNICDLLIRELSEEGDIVFDPFLGSGVTILESIKKDSNRIGIGCEINEMPLFIPKTLLSDCFEDDIDNLIKDFIAKVIKLNSYYKTACPRCGQQANVNNVVFDKPFRNKNDINIKAINYTCTKCKRAVKEANKEDYEKINAVDNINNIVDISLLQNSKIAIGENDRISDIFTKRNFIVLDRIISIIETYPQSKRQILYYILMSILHLAKITDKHSNSQWPLWIPKFDCVEKNIVEILMKKSRLFLRTVAYVKKHYYEGSIVNSYSELINNKCLLIHKGSQHLTNEDIPDNSVSLIVTDPPYLEQVMYSEYMQLYKPFIDLDFNLKDEIVVSSSPKREKSKEKYFELLCEVFKVCSSKLKLNRYMCLFFHDSNLDVWYQLISSLEKNGFKYVSQTHIQKTKTLKNIISPKKSLNGDAVLFFINTGEPFNSSVGVEDINEIENNIIRQAKYLIEKQGSLSTTELYDNGLMEVIIHNGWLKSVSEHYNSLVDIFEKHLFWDKELARWKIAER